MKNTQKTYRVNIKTLMVEIFYTILTNIKPKKFCCLETFLKCFIRTIVIFISFISGGCHKATIHNQMAYIASIPSVYEEIKNIPIIKNCWQNKITIKRMGGWSNFTYLISASENSKFVLRAPQKNSSKLKALLNIDTYNEYINSNKACLLGIGAKVEFFDVAKGILLLKYVENRKTLEEIDFENPEVLKNTTLLLKRLHFSKARFKNDINMLSILEKLAVFFNKQYMDETPKDVNIMMTQLKKLENLLRNVKITTVPYHGDPNPGNFLLTHNGIILVDWEYSGNGDPAWDLALLSTTAKLNDKQDYLMLSTYNNINDQTLFNRFIVYKALVQLWRFYWLRFRAMNVEDHVEKNKFFELSDRRYNESKQIMLSHKFQNAVNELIYRET